MIANPFKDIQVFYDGVGNTAVSWILDERFDDPYPHSFELQFSKSATGFHSNDYEVVDSGIDIAYLKDRKFRFAGFAGSAHYRVVIRTPAGAYVSLPKGITGNVDKKNLGIMRELLRKESLALRSDRGAAAGYLFKRRYYGPRCECTDPNTDTVVSTACVKCAGTGFKYGYFPGVEFPILITSAESPQVQMSDVGAINLKAVEARCLAFPVAEPKDIWLEKDTSRVYEIKKCSIISRYSYAPIAAQMELRELTLADTVSLIVSSLRDVSVPKDTTSLNSYYSPIIISNNPALTAGAVTASQDSVGLVSASNSPFAELVANNNILSQTGPINLPATLAIPSIAISPPSDTDNVTAPTPTPIITEVVCDDNLDGGIY